MKVIVVDIETKDTLQTAAILSIGAVVVDTDTLRVDGRKFYQTISEDQPGRTVSESTMAWWEGQKTENPIAYQGAFSGGACLSDVLNDFKDWVELFEIDRPQVFGNGPEFDNAILEHAFRTELECSAPWDYGSNQSIRTAGLFGKMLLGIDPKRTIEFTGNPHTAINDAEHEAKILIEVLKGFKEALAAELIEGYQEKIKKMELELKDRALANGIIAQEVEQAGEFVSHVGLHTQNGHALHFAGMAEKKIKNALDGLGVLV